MSQTNEQPMDHPPMTTTSPSLPSAVADAVTLLRAYARVFGVLARREPAQADVAADALETAWAAHVAAPAVGLTREQVEALRRPHAADCEPRRVVAERYCSCGAFAHNEVLEDVLALYRSEDATPEGERR